MRFKIAKNVPANVAGNGQVEMGGFCQIPHGCVTSTSLTLAQHVHAVLHFFAGLLG